MKRFCPVFLVLPLALACTPHARAPLSDMTAAHELDAPDRDEWQMPHAIVQALEIKPGMSVVDLGAGTGYMLPFLSEAVGPNGKVYALEIQKDFATMLRFRTHHEQLANVEVVEDTATTLNLPTKVDRVLLLNTYRQLDEPIAMLKAIRAALNPGGLVVIVDTRPDPNVEGPPPEQRVSPTSVEAEARGASLTVIADSTQLPRDYLLVLVDEDEAAKMPPASTPTTR
jgi:predicted methyltransferase